MAANEPTAGYAREMTVATENHKALYDSSS